MRALLDRAARVAFGMTPAVAFTPNGWTNWYSDRKRIHFGWVGEILPLDVVGGAATGSLPVSCASSCRLTSSAAAHYLAPVFLRYRSPCMVQQRCFLH